MPMDLLCVRTANPLTQTNGAVGFGFGTTTFATVGHQKVAQQFLVMFETPKGSFLADRTFGVSSPLLPGKVNLGNPEALTSAINQNLREILDWWSKNVPTETVPPDEFLIGASLTVMQADPGTGNLNLTISLQTADNNQTIVQPPIKLG